MSLPSAGTFQLLEPEINARRRRARLSKAIRMRSLVDIEGVEGFAVPPDHGAVLQMHRIADSFEKLHEPADTAYVLWRAPSFAVDEHRVVYVRFTLADAFDDDIVAPVVAEVVNVKESLDAARNQGSQPQPRRPIELEAPELVLLARNGP